MAIKSTLLRQRGERYKSWSSLWLASAGKVRLLYHFYNVVNVLGLILWMIICNSKYLLIGDYLRNVPASGCKIILLWCMHLQLTRGMERCIMYWTWQWFGHQNVCNSLKIRSMFLCWLAVAFSNLAVQSVFTLLWNFLVFRGNQV